LTLSDKLPFLPPFIRRGGKKLELFPPLNKRGDEKLKLHLPFYSRTGKKLDCFLYSIFIKIHLQILFLLLFCSLSFAQTIGKKLDLKTPLTEQLKSTVGLEAPSASILEGPIDPKNYYLGPGDQLLFSVWGGIEFQYPAAVNPTGTLNISTLGELDVAGKTVHQADSMLCEKAKSVYPKSKVNLQLVCIRSFKVSISGAVFTPGIYEISAIDRLSTLITKAGGFLLPREETEDKTKTTGRRIKSDKISEDTEKDVIFASAEILSSFRRIRITDRVGQTRNIDYQRYMRSGDLKFNPIIQEGDEVQVPIQEKGSGVLNIFGAIKAPGEYEFIESDRLMDLVEIAGGYKADALLDEVMIIRFADESNQNQNISVKLNPDAGDRGLQLQPDDRVFIRTIPDFRPKYYVRIQGEVVFPGVYPINENITTLSDMIVSCGGFTGKANLNSAKVIRTATSNEDDPEYKRLQQMTVTEMQDMEYEYYKTLSRLEAPAVVVDFVKLFVNKEKDRDVLLRDRDIIDIPAITPTVNVAGQVNSPGLVNFIEGKSYEYYIGEAGGFSWNANKGKTRLIKAQTGRWIKPKKNTTIEIGDTIFVPEKQELEYWELWKDMLLIVSQIATILLVIRSIK